jgi:MFS family permease
MSRGFRRAGPQSMPTQLMGRVGKRFRAITDALGVPAFRRYFFAQFGSVSATWMKSVAQLWFIIEQHGSGLEIGGLLALQTAPVLIIGLYAGVLADRIERRKLVFITQLISAATALAAGIAVWSDSFRLWELYLLAGVLGAASAIETPARQTMVVDMVGMRNARSALAISGMSLSLGRFLGAACAGFVITSVPGGLAACFLVNSASFIVVAAVLLATKSSGRPDIGGQVGSGSLRAGIAVIRSSTVLRRVVPGLLIVGLFSLNLQVFTPLLADESFRMGAGGLSVLTSATGLGAFFGAMLAAGGAGSRRSLAMGSILLGVLLGFSGFVRIWPVTICLFFGIGVAAAVFLASSNFVLQESSPEGYRGRVTAFYGIAVNGTSLVGAPLLGFICGSVSLHLGFVLGATAAAVTGVVLLFESGNKSEPIPQRQSQP